MACLDPAAHQGEHAGAVRATVAEIPDEHQLAACRMAAVVVIAQMPDQLLQCLALAMHITDHIQRAGGQCMYQAHRRCSINSAARTHACAAAYYKRMTHCARLCCAAPERLRASRCRTKSGLGALPVSAISYQF
ncbi:hypothetical protein D3C72_1915980 [compost metagenome]